MKGERRYRYYVSKALQTGGALSAAAGMRIPASDIERAVTDRLAQFLADRSAVYNVVSAAVIDGAEQSVLLDRAAALANV